MLPQTFEMRRLRSIPQRICPPLRGSVLAASALVYGMPSLDARARAANFDARFLTIGLPFDTVPPCARHLWNAGMVSARDSENLFLVAAAAHRAR